MSIRTTQHLTTYLILLLGILSLPLIAAEQDDGDDPRRWEDTINEFEKTARSSPEPKDAVVFVGSSSNRRWSTLRDDMAPIPVIQRGFGGSRLGDAAYYGLHMSAAGYEIWKREIKKRLAKDIPELLETRR
jgi:hypothetical protein